MFACTFAAAAALTLSATADPIPGYAAEVESEARALRDDLAAAGEPGFMAALEDFSGDAMRLSTSLREAGVVADMPCIFKGISEDAEARAAALPSLGGPARDLALGELRALLDDAILLAPMAGAEAEKARRAAERRDEAPAIGLSP